MSVSGDVLDGVRIEVLVGGDWRVDLLRKTTPPNEPRIFLVTLPLPTDILKE